MSPKAWGVEFDLFGGPTVDEPKFDEEGEYAVVTICGPMTKSGGWWGDSYEDIRERAQAAFGSSAEAVCLRIDSPGGDLAGCFELAHDLRAMKEGSGKRLVAFTDGDCCSGAMALASPADEIVATPQAFLGSIGVWAALVDATASDALWGIKVVIASSGEHKADWNPHVPMTEEAFNRLQAQVVAQAELFFSLVSENRGVSVDALRALKGAAPFGQAALAAGLCDRLVPSWSAFLSGDDAMSVKSKNSKYDEAMGALRAAAEEDSEDGKKAKKALSAIDKEGEESEEDKKKKKDDEEKAAAKKVEEDKEKEKAQATITSLAATVQALQTDLTERDRKAAAAADTQARAAIFAKRPDLNETVRTALETMPTAALEKAIEAMPRVSAAAYAAAGATLPAVSGGERVQGGARPLGHEEQAVFDRTDPFKRSQSSAKASFQGSEFTMPSRMLSASEAAARAAEIAKEMGQG